MLIVSCSLWSEDAIRDPRSAIRDFTARPFNNRISVQPTANSEQQTRERSDR
jgi:hypothetical protein